MDVMAHADPPLDMALTAALLEAVGAGDVPATARVYRPAPTMAFGRLDQIRPGFADAVAAARAHGFSPLLRLGGGHAAAYDAGSLVVDLVVPVARIAEGVEERFREGTEVCVDALESVGLDVRIGELRREYCPGRWSVNAGGVKLAGTAQRSIRGASLLAAVIVVTGGERIRAALTDVYAALEMDWDPRTAGAAEDLEPGLTVAEVEAAVVQSIGARYGGTRVAEPSAAVRHRV
jgi:octanoyl-[GcvH]:protein N-octanoyltransferase